MTDRPVLEDEIEVTPEMIEVGEDLILCKTGAVLFSAADLALQVYRAMERSRREGRSLAYH